MYAKCDKCSRPARLAPSATGAALCAACSSLARVTGTVRHSHGRATRAGQLDAFKGRDARGVSAQLDIFGGAPAGRDAIRDGR